jgi:hypothetical protein
MERLVEWKLAGESDVLGEKLSSVTTKTWVINIIIIIIITVVVVVVVVVAVRIIVL